MNKVKQWFKSTTHQVIAIVIAGFILLGVGYAFVNIISNQNDTVVVNDLIIFEYGETEFDEKNLFKKVIDMDKSLDSNGEAPQVVYEKNVDYANDRQKILSESNDTIYYEFKEIKTDSASFGYQERAEVIGLERQDNDLPDYATLSTSDIKRLVASNSDNDVIEIEFYTAVLHLKQGDTILKEIEYNYFVIDSEAPVLEGISKVEIAAGENPDFSSFKAKDPVEGDVEIKIAGDYDINKVGTYELKVMAIDKNNNKTEQTFQLVVKEKASETSGDDSSDESWRPAYEDGSSGQSQGSSSDSDWKWGSCFDYGDRQICEGTGTDLPWQINP